MNKSTKIKLITTAVIVGVVAIFALIAFAGCTDNIGTGYVGYKYDRTLPNNTSVTKLSMYSSRQLKL